MKSPRLPRLLLPLALPLFALLLCALPALAKPPAPTDQPELRAFWVDGFNDGFKTPAQCDLLLHRLRAMHCNAVFVQMRKRADAYYATHYEQWAQDDPQHFDSLQYLCDHAHAPGKPRIQIHAWINACAVGGNASAGALTKLHPEWLSLSDTGADYDGEATKIDPGNPDAAEWTYRVYMDVVRHYDVDGIHLDFIRYGGDGKTVGHWGYNVVSVARFNARYHATGRPAWDDPRWQAWRRAQVTSLVRRVYVGATALKPHLVVSAATICWGDPPASDAAYEAHSTSYTEVFAPWRDWMREGILDMNCPMAYFPNARMGQRWRGWNTYAKDRAYGRQVALGVGLYLNSVTSSLAQIDDTRQASASGHHAAGAVLYCYDTPRGTNGHEVEGDTSLFAALPTVFRHDAPPPAMPWKDAPTRGAVSGALLAGDALTPVDGATVTARSVETGETRTGESDGNGRFAFVSLPPGAYKVTASWPGGGQNWDVSVLAGKTSQILAAQPGTAAPQAQVAGLGEAADGAHVLLGPALVTSGSDRLGDHFFVADAIGQTPVRVESGRLALPAITGDRVLVSGTLHHTAAGIVMQADAVRVVGMEIVGAG